MVAAIAVNLMCATNAVAEDYKVLNLSGMLSAAETSWTGDESGTSSVGFLGETIYANSFSDGVFVFSNTYVPDWFYWSDFSYTNTTDVATPGYTNLSAITGAGYDDGDDTYVIASIGESTIITFADRAMYKDVSMYVTNAAYAYLSMQQGDAWAKKFGGDDGTDADSLMLIATVYDAAGEVSGEKRLALADFRFENSDDDYMLNEWTELDLSLFGRISAITFSMESSDMDPDGMFMNTPAYFCLDGLRGVQDGFVSIEQPAAADKEGSVYYANGALYVNGLAGAQIQLVSVMGATVASFVANSDNEVVPFGSAQGVYIVRAVKEGKAYIYKISAR